MRLLMIGGTRFVGRGIVDAALAAGDDVTIFHRGKTGLGSYEGKVKEILGDRDGGLDGLKGQTWDAAIDTCGYYPRVVRQSAELLKGSVGTYTFISSISVYSEDNKWPAGKDVNVIHIPADTKEEITSETYGGLKVLCEEAVQELHPEGGLIVRPGLVVGPGDYSDRFTYWPVRFSQGGEVLVPDCPETPLQFIDARDLGAFTYRVTADRRSRAFAATGPTARMTFREFFETIQKACGPESRLVWVDEKFIIDQGAQPWMELPLWMGPLEDPDTMMSDLSDSIEAGLKTRPLAETAKDTLAWKQARPVEDAKAGLPAAKEADLLAAWQATQKN
jgi:2'-hydroxyisoflavone reductase